MATVRKAITLTEAQDRWLQDQIEAGIYSDDSDCIRNLIEREQARNAEVDAVRAALLIGERSCEPLIPFDGTAFKQRMIARYR